MERYTLSIIVRNHPGVLSRVSGLFSRRGYNIESLSVGVAEDTDCSRMTIVVLGDKDTVQQIINQLSKLIDVEKIRLLDRDHSVSRGLMLIKVRADRKNRSEILQYADIFRANVIDVQEDSLIVEVTGDQGKQDAMLAALEPFGILEIAKTGICSLSRGNH